MTQSPIGRVLVILGVNLLVLAVVAVLAEAIFGTWFSRDPLDRLALPRDVRYAVNAGPLYPGGTVFTYRRDHWGFRGPDLDPATIAVVTLGGSTTNQLYLPEEATWQAEMARAFAQDGRPLVVVNAGIDGQSTVGHLVGLESWLTQVPGLRPRVVLAYVGLNDVYVGGNVVDELKHSSTFKWFSQNSALFRMWQSLLGALKARKAKLNHEVFDYATARWTTEAALDPGSDRSPAEFGKRLRLMAEKIRRLGAEPVFVTQSRGDFRRRDGTVEGVVRPEGANGVDDYRRLMAFNAQTMAVCRDLGLRCLDLGTELAFGAGDFYDIVHNTPQGAAKIGRFLFEGLRDHPLLAR